MKIINTINQIKNIYSKGSFDIKKWKEYINSIDSKIEELCIFDMKETIDTGLYTFEKNFLQILNLVINEQNKLEELSSNFNIVTKELNFCAFLGFIVFHFIFMIFHITNIDHISYDCSNSYLLLGIKKLIMINV